MAHAARSPDRKIRVYAGKPGKVKRCIFTLRKYLNLRIEIPEEMHGKKYCIVLEPEKK